MNVLDLYITTAPSQQNAVDIFKGEWASSFPGNTVSAGSALLFEDARIEWAIPLLGVEGTQVLELGPLEAGHSYMMERAGAEGVTSVESNSRAYLRCLIAKEITKLKKVDFLYGDFIEYLKNPSRTFDICIGSGVLYHMKDPVEVITLMSSVADKLFIWTHYYDEGIIQGRNDLKVKFPGKTVAEHKGFKHTLYRQEYQVALDHPGFCGGNDLFSNWLSREDILACLKHLGYTRIEINFEQRDHPNGPSFAVVATK